MTRDGKKTPSNSTSRRAEAEARSFLRAAFEDADVDNSGSLTMMESMAMVSDLVRVRETQLQEAQSWEQLRAALFCIAPVVAAAAFGFQHFERAAGNEFGILDAFYFVIVSLTTVGLGDIVPSEGLSMIYWYVWMTVGLGLIALILSTAGVILASTSERVALTATKARKKRNGDGKKSKRTRIEPQPVRGYVEEDVDVERAFERKNSKWGKKSIDG
jgi:heme exporter protein D